MKVFGCSNCGFVLPGGQKHYNTILVLNRMKGIMIAELFCPICGSPMANYENGHEYVDLGLSIKWATCNVGAEKPEDYGFFYSWGETEFKYSYRWSSYQWCYGSGKYDLKKYNGVDNKSSLDRKDDVAYVEWGGTWRMPTKTELQELIDNCTWEWITMNAVDGYKVTSNKSGYTNRYIFLPAAGCRNDTSQKQVVLGYYWSRTNSYLPSAYALLFDEARKYVDHNDRFRGYSVRPVCP